MLCYEFLTRDETTLRRHVGLVGEKVNESLIHIQQYLLEANVPSRSIRSGAFVRTSYNNFAIINRNN